MSSVKELLNSYSCYLLKKNIPWGLLLLPITLLSNTNFFKVFYFFKNDSVLAIDEALFSRGKAQNYRSKGKRCSQSIQRCKFSASRGGREHAALVPFPSKTSLLC